VVAPDTRRWLPRRGSREHPYPPEDRRPHPEGPVVQIALVTGGTAAPDVDAPLVTALRTRGATVHTPSWGDPDVDWTTFDVAVVRTAWDYPERRNAFVDWAARVASATALWNPADVLRWNTHKSYLLELEDRGAPVVPTAWLAAGDRVDLAELLATRDWKRAVVKPAVGNGADGVLRTFDVSDAAAQAHLDRVLDAGDAMVQPYLEAVASHGEVSVVAVDGEVTHVVRKVPAAGDYRVQEDHGGVNERLDLDGDGAEPAALARWVLDAAGHELLFARVDLVQDENAAWQVAELEVTEPDLYLGVAPDVGEVLARAILARA
jgi:glutathione synthase/RimK-type ligase-like ATP-grasp enzyme